MNTFKKNLQIIMEQNNLTQKQLSNLTGIPSSSIASWLSSRESLPNIEVVAKLADYFKCSIDYLIGRESEEGIILINNQSKTMEKNSPKTQLEELFEKLDKQNKMMVLGYITALLEKQNQLNGKR